MTLTLPTAPVVAPRLHESPPVASGISAMASGRHDAGDDGALVAADSAWLAATRATLAHLAHLARPLPPQD